MILFNLAIVDKANTAQKIPEDGQIDTYATCMLKKFNVVSYTA